MRVATLAVAVAIAFPTFAFAEGGNVDINAGTPRTGAAADSSRLPPSPGVTQNAPGQQRPTNGTPGDPGNTGSDSGMEASDDKPQSTAGNMGQGAASSVNNRTDSTNTQLSGPNAAPRVPEAATDVPVKAPGPVTGNPTAAGPSKGPVEPTKPVTHPEANKPNSVIAPSGPTGARPSDDTR